MWNLLTSNTTKPVDILKVSSLILFSTNQPLNSTIATVNPQAQYTQSSKPSFESITDIELQLPTDSKIYIVDFLVEVDSLIEVFNINLLETESYYRDYVQNKTYILSSSSSLNIRGNLLLDYSQFSEINYTYSYSFDGVQSFDIDLIDVNGLLYKPGNFTFDGTTISITASACCGPQEGDLFSLDISYTEEEASKVYDVYLFDFSLEDIDMVDSLSWNNTQFQFSNEITSNTLLFNRVSKTAICIRK